MKTGIFEFVIQKYDMFPAHFLNNPVIHTHSIGKQFQKSCFHNNNLISFIDQFTDSQGQTITRDQFDEIQKWFLGGIYEHFACQHSSLINPIFSWSIIQPSPMSDSYIPAFSITTPSYPKGNLYDHMKTWSNIQNFNEETATLILYGIARAFLRVQFQGFETHNFSPQNIYLTDFKFINSNDQIMNLLKPTLCDLGYQSDRNLNDPSTLIPPEIKRTTDPRIKKFIIMLYFLFQKSEDKSRSILSDFYGIDKSGIDVDYQTNDRLIHNPQLFLERFFATTSPSDEVYNSSPLECYIKSINSFSAESSIDNRVNIDTSPGYFTFLTTLSNDNQLRLPLITKILNDKYLHTPQDKLLGVYEFLAVIYSCGYVENYVDYRLAAYYARKALKISKLSPTVILTKFPNCYFPTTAERLFHEGEVLEGNAIFYAEENDPDAQKVLTMAANKYKESALKGFDRAKTRLAILLLDLGKYSQEMIIRSLLIPASRTDPAAIEVIHKLENQK